jgi:gamma-glutamyltranspeptidase/glutathione hydrolase
MLETLKILEGLDLKLLGHNSLNYVHMVSQALGLAFADREAYLGDPKFVDVPTAGMVSDTYGALQRARIDPQRASQEMAAPGNPRGAGFEPPRPVRMPEKQKSPMVQPQDTIYGCAVDAQGNAYSCTPSDNQNDTPIIPGTGLTISSRGNQSRLIKGHPSEVQPGKRPRLTPSPALAVRDGKVFMAFGTPGGDIQKQAMLQVLLNVYEFGMSVQTAVEQPRFANYNFPNSFAPHQYHPGRLCAEKPLADKLGDALRKMGHQVEVWPQNAPTAGGVCAIMRDVATGLLHAGADCRREGSAQAW